MPEEPKIVHDLVPTPNPSELSLVIDVPVSVFAMSNRQMPTASTNGVIGDKYASEAFKFLVSAAWVKGYGDYVFVDVSKPMPQWLRFHFIKEKTAAQRASKEPFRSMPSFGNHRWNAILKKLSFFQDNSFPLAATIIKNGQKGTVTAPRTYDQVVYVPEINEGTLFLEEEFFSDTPFVIPQYEVPIPTAVSYVVPGGASGNFQECLHPKVVIPDLRAGSLVFIGGAQSDSGGNVRGQVFPETNQTGWERYVLSHKQKFEVGYYGYRVTVNPPDEPEVDVR